MKDNQIQSIKAKQAQLYREFQAKFQVKFTRDKQTRPLEISAEQKRLLAWLQNEEAMCSLYLPLALHIFERFQEHIKAPQAAGCFMIGISGCQGSGKTTTVSIVKFLLEKFFGVDFWPNCGLTVLTASIDDFYLPKAERNRLGRAVHPLLKTRGVPGTHDTEKLLATFKKLRDKKQGQLHLPIFDKGLDERLASKRTVELPYDIFLFEGWCVAAKASSIEDLDSPINALERNFDSLKIWRNYINTRLEKEYYELFKQLDYLVAFVIDDFSWVYQWRRQQEESLPLERQMDALSLSTFMAHFERLTRQLLQTLPMDADLLISLNKDRTVKQLKAGRQQQR